LTHRDILIVGGAGFIGSHFTDALLADADVQRVTLYDNFSSGKEWHIAPHREDDRLHIVRGDAENLDALTIAMQGHSMVIHLASNPDIARAATDPSIDFRQGTVLTQNVVEAMRQSGAQRLLYASGSGIYGDLGEEEIGEDHGPLLPISTYGASKLAGEALICSYCHMFDMSARVFRFGNVVGPRQTHGVGLDFIKRLLKDSTRLRILGDGSQSKPYVHVQDVVAGVLLANEKSPAAYAVYNLATEDYVSVSDIAEFATQVVGVPMGGTVYEFTGGRRGWKGDVPVVRMDSSRIRGLGWSNVMTSREAIEASLRSLHAETLEGLH
jgi:UDP-glucose 4-epimerase